MENKNEDIKIDFEVEDKPRNEAEAVLKRIIEHTEEKSRLTYAIEILQRATKYIQGYLIDYDITFLKNYRGDPLFLAVIVYINPNESEMPPFASIRRDKHGNIVIVKNPLVE